jgi:hypothetical protein
LARLASPDSGVLPRQDIRYRVRGGHLSPRRQPERWPSCGVPEDAARSQPHGHTARTPRTAFVFSPCLQPRLDRSQHPVQWPVIVRRTAFSRAATRLITGSRSAGPFGNLLCGGPSSTSALAAGGDDRRPRGISYRHPASPSLPGPARRGKPSGDRVRLLSAGCLHGCAGCRRPASGVSAVCVASRLSGSRSEGRSRTSMRRGRGSTTCLNTSGPPQQASRHAASQDPDAPQEIGSSTVSPHLRLFVPPVG